MAETKDIGSRGYWHWAWYPDKTAARFALEPTTEIDWPYRRGTALVVRLPFDRRAIVVGVWTGNSKSEEEAILTATGGHVLREAGIKRPDEELIPGAGYVDLRHEAEEDF